jgi:hypothetical protein
LLHEIRRFEKKTEIPLAGSENISALEQITVLPLRWRYSASSPWDFAIVLRGLLLEYQQRWAVGWIKMDGSCSFPGTVKVL